MNKTKMDAFERMLNCKRESCPSYSQYEDGCVLADERLAESLDSPTTSWGSEACEALEHEVAEHG